MSDTTGPAPGGTRGRLIRVPDALWEAYGRVCGTLDTDRTGDLLDHMRDRIRTHGTDQDQADLAAAEAELAARRARKGGRPKGGTKQAPPPAG